MSLRIVPVTRDIANEFVRRLHRHHKPTLGAVFYVGVASDAHLHGVAVVGRPVARMLDDGLTLEINRTCTDGTPNACSMLLGACRRIGRALGYTRIITYTLPSEGGSSLKAAGFRFDGEAGDTSKRWNARQDACSRDAPALDGDLFGGKWRWAA